MRRRASAPHPLGRRISAFRGKTVDPEEWTDGAFFVLEPGMVDYIAGGDIHWEREPLSRLAAAGEFMAHRHDGFWQCMDTLKEAQDLRALWRNREDKISMDPGVWIMVIRAVIIVLELVIALLDRAWPMS